MWDKKAMDAGGALIIFFALMVIMLFLVVPYAFVKTPEQVQAQVPKDIEYAIYEQRFLHTCFAYIDETTKNIHPNIIDAKKVTMPQINICFDKGIDISVTVTYADKKIGPLNEQSSSISRTYPITIYENDKFTPGVMELRYG